jgi:hypothetical protein
MTNLKLLKFRSLASETDFERAKEIIEKSKFWFSKLWNLNDPIEGVYKNKSFGKIDIEKTFNGKNDYVICSFSCGNVDTKKLQKPIKAPINNPLLWGYYANGFKGIAIEVEIEEYDVSEVDYKSKSEFYKNLKDAKTIITRKLIDWVDEGEYRFLKQGGVEGKYEMGKITKVYFGNPNGSINNYDQVLNNSKSLRKYLFYRQELILICKAHGIEPIVYDIL